MRHKCSKCTTALIAGGHYCHHCGAKIEQGFKESEEANDPFDLKSSTPMATNIAAMLCYLVSFLGAVLFLSTDPYRSSKLVRFHAWQSIFFFLTWIGFQVLSGILFWGIMFLWYLTPMFHSAFVVIWILLMVKAYRGEYFVLPILGDMAKKRAASLL